MKKERFRIERDSMGEVNVPENAYYGAQTQRAVENFPISGLKFQRRFIRALGLIKMAAAHANADLGLLDKDLSKAIQNVAREVMAGKYDKQFVVDIFQTGSGTSTNMNANEVISSRANEILGGNVGDKLPIHPNNHVNMGQSSNDVMPAAMHIASYELIQDGLLPSLKGLKCSFEQKTMEFYNVIKIGRTHLQDAVPMRLGQEFSGYATMLKHAEKRLENAIVFLSELPIGGTAVGTGMNTHPRFADMVISTINQVIGLKFRGAENRFESLGSKDAMVEVSSSLKTIAVSLMKIANDIRLLSSGPRCGIGEILVPAVQPGSSIMPGKVNPVMAEMICQVAAKVIGNDATITVGGLSGNLELNTMMPIIAHSLLESIEILSNGTRTFNEKCVKGIKADALCCTQRIEKSLALAAALNPFVGYDQAANVAKEAHETGRSIKEVAMERRILPQEKLDKILDPLSMV